MHHKNRKRPLSQIPDPFPCPSRAGKELCQSKNSKGSQQHIREKASQIRKPVRSKVRILHALQQDPEHRKCRRSRKRKQNRNRFPSVSSLLTVPMPFPPGGVTSQESSRSEVGQNTDRCFQLPGKAQMNVRPILSRQPDKRNGHRAQVRPFHPRAPQQKIPDQLHPHKTYQKPQRPVPLHESASGIAIQHSQKIRTDVKMVPVGGQLRRGISPQKAVNRNTDAPPDEIWKNQ